MADGSLVIDTSLDRSGFEKGSEKMIASMNSLAHRVEVVGAEMKQALLGIAPILQSIAAAAQQSASGVNTGAQTATRAAQQTAAAQQATTAAVGQAAAATDQAAKAASAYDKELDKLQKQIDTAKNKLTGYYQEVAAIEQSTDESLRFAETQEQVENVLQIEQIQLDGVNKKYADKIAVLQALEAEYARVQAARDAANTPQAEPAQEQHPGATLTRISFKLCRTLFCCRASSM